MSEAFIPLMLLVGWLAAMLWHAVAEDRRSRRDPPRSGGS